MKKSIFFLLLVICTDNEPSVDEEHENESKIYSKYSNTYPTRCNVTQFILSGNCSTCFGWYHHPSSGAQTTVSTASGISHTVIAICRYRGRVGTGLSAVWVAYATHSTLKPVMLSVCQRPRQQTLNITSITNTYCCEYSNRTSEDGQ